MKEVKKMNEHKICLECLYDLQSNDLTKILKEGDTLKIISVEECIKQEEATK